MKKSQLTKITTILPFDGKYIKVGKNRNKLWNLMDSEGNFISETWFENIEKTTDGAIITKAEKKEMRFVNVGSFKKFNSTKFVIRYFFFFTHHFKRFHHIFFGNNDTACG